MDLASVPSPATLIARSTAAMFMVASQPQVYLPVNRRMVSRINLRFHPIGMRNRTHKPSAAGKVILERLEFLGKTQQWLAEKVEVSKNAVTKWIRTGKISRENLPAIAHWLQLDSIDQLLKPSVDRIAETIPAYVTKNEALISAYWRASDEARVIVDKILFEQAAEVITAKPSPRHPKRSQPITDQESAIKKSKKKMLK